PLQIVAQSLSSPGIDIIITIGASMAMLGVLLSQILGISRMMLAMGRRHDLPPFFKNIHSKYNVPHIGILFSGIIILVLTMFGSFDFIVRAATFTILLYYGIANIAALKQPDEEIMYPKFIPIAGLAGCIILSVSLPWEVILSGIGILFIGFILRFFNQRIFSR
ncbi:MAG: amino acid permease, partial [Ginsengibacter sp.]